MAVSDPSEISDPVYRDGLRNAISSALAYGLAVLENGEGNPEPVPVALLAQARVAARNRVGLGTVLRRYCAGHGVLADFLFEEAGNVGLATDSLRRILNDQSSALDRLLATVGEEYRREADRGTGGILSPQQRQAAQLRRLLDGEPLDTSEFDYGFDGWHIGAIGVGGDAAAAFRSAAVSLNRSLLVVTQPGDYVWAWLGGKSRPTPDDLEHLSRDWKPRMAVAVGEPAEGLAGWRLTHRQAAVSLPIARSSQEVTRYANVMLLCAALGDELLAASLRQLYLEPLRTDADDGGPLLKALRAYFASDRNTSSAAAALGLDRRTVSRRLRAVERALARPVVELGPELELALRLDRRG
ncbi:MAG TPA: helix-turn-helix domain-containing protein [Solirubrobacterales bacterium]|nr:helix-turn-helix domain-containing protein [Solirubrobacterales bacterium]